MHRMVKAEIIISTTIDDESSSSTSSDCNENDVEDHDNYDDGSSSEQQQQQTLRYAQKLLYLSYFGREFSEYTWQFALVVWLEALSDNSSLFLISLYQATAQLLVLIFVPRMSQYIDNTAAATSTSASTTWNLNRRQFASYFITSEKICILIATLMIGWTMKRRRNSNMEADDTYSSYVQGDDDALWICSLIGICLFGGFAQVLYKTFFVALERDWIVVMSNSNKGNQNLDKDDDNWLQNTNIVLQQISLICQFLGPSITGYILSSSNNNKTKNIGAGFGWMVFCTILSLIVEYICLNQVYHLVPALHKLQQENNNNGTCGFSIDDDDEEEETYDHQDNNNNNNNNNSKNRSKLSIRCYVLNQLLQYSSQTMVWAGIGLALMYFNVLTFGGMMTAYLVSCDMSLSTIGVWHGVSSIIGLLGTVVFAQSQKYHMTLESTALWGIVWDVLCLSIALSSIFVVSEDDLSARLLIAGVLPSRIGLFVYDISVTQLFQKTVPAQFRGQVGGIQIFLNSFFGYLLFVLGMIFSNVQDFWILIIVGYVSIVAAMIFYFLGTYLPYKDGYSDLRPMDDNNECIKFFNRNAMYN